MLPKTLQNIYFKEMLNVKVDRKKFVIELWKNFTLEWLTIYYLFY